MTAVAAWTAVLDELEHTLTAGAVGKHTWAPPADLPPLPGQLVARAEALLERQQAVQRELAAERDRVGAEVDAQRRATRSSGAPAPATGPGLAL